MYYLRVRDMLMLIPVVLPLPAQGQSNMEMTVEMAFNASTEVADSINYPNLR